ncbi:alpha-hydroxy-acid oxidizing protein [Agrobacterium sp. 22094]|uniref:alpha-hydroxy-acid oxidizing protein n=1 Tax=Agrobacterium sp. 22094 TaxID=3453872 RepID=UPI003F826624
MFDRINLQPKRLTDVERRDLSIELSERISRSIMVAANGLNGCFWSDGEVALACAAEKAGVPFPPFIA